MKTTRRNPRLIRRAAVTASAALMLASAAASGIDIQVTYNAGASNPPATDPNGTRLMTIMNHAASFYESVFRDTHTLTLNVFYEDLTDNTLGSHTLLSQSGGRETSGRAPRS